MLTSRHSDRVRTCACALLLSVTVAGAPAAEDLAIVSGKTERRAVASALELVPRSLRRPIVVIDPEGTADPATIRLLDAFIVREPDEQLRQKIYINRESRILREAVKGVDFYVKALAALLVHEAAHLDGKAEPDARAAEIDFLRDLMSRGLVRQDDARRYLALLRQQP